MNTIALKQKRASIIRIRITIHPVLLKFWMAICDIAYAIGFLGRYIFNCIIHPKRLFILLADVLYFTLKFVFENFGAILLLVLVIIGSFVVMLWIAGSMQYLNL